MLEIIKGSLPKSVYDKLHRRNLKIVYNYIIQSFIDLLNE